MASDPETSAARPPVVHRARRRIAIHETDASGLIFFGVVGTWANESFCGWLAAAGRPLSSLLASSVAIPTRRFESEFLTPLALDDEVEMQLRPFHVGRTSFALELSAVRAEDDLTAVTVRTWHVFARFAEVGAGQRPAPQSAPLPTWLREALAA